MKIVAVIVTYNRLSLLKKCLNSVIEQKRKPDEIIVINNGSTDETERWLFEQPVFLHTQQNSGGAGGFSTGLKLAYQHGADWIWLMDDDTIPNVDALEYMEQTLESLGPNQHKVGFLSSLVYWTDGNLHEMNRTYHLTDQSKLAKFTLPNQPDLPIIQFGTFVSMLISARVVEKLGLPIKEFFIWNDDVEYSKRIVNSGLAGLLVKKSVVMHETPINNMSSVFNDSHVHLWKYRYGLRNEMFTKRLHEGELRFWITWLHRMFILPIRILINRKDNRWAFNKVIWKTSLEAVFFRPEIEKANDQQGNNRQVVGTTS